MLKDVTEVITGRNAITGQELDGLDRSITAIAAVVPFIPASWARAAKDKLVPTLIELKNGLVGLAARFPSLKAGAERVIKTISDLIGSLTVRAAATSGAGPNVPIPNGGKAPNIKPANNPGNALDKTKNDLAPPTNPPSGEHPKLQPDSSSDAVKQSGADNWQFVEFLEH